MLEIPLDATRGHVRLFVPTLILLVTLTGFSSLASSPPFDPTAGNTLTVVLTADTEGHIGPCNDCPYHPGLGGLTRRASRVVELRKTNSSILFLDAGNCFIGSESLASGGKVIVAAYNALSYDAVNLCHRDFWFGKAETLALLKEVKFAVLSANLLDYKNGQPLAQPYVVKKIGSQRIALIGVADAPAGMDFLPHLKERLAGIRIQPPVEAVEKWLPKAKAESDRVILLYYGSATRLNEVRERFAGSFSAILVGGLRPEQVPSDARPPVIATSNHGRHLAKVYLTATGADISQIAIEPSLEPSVEMEKVLAKYQKPGKR